jgi:hypothetical protein
MTKNQKIILTASSLLVIVIGFFTYDYLKIVSAYNTPLPPDDATQENDKINVNTNIIESTDELNDNLPHGNTSIADDDSTTEIQTDYFLLSGGIINDNNGDFLFTTNTDLLLIDVIDTGIDYQFYFIDNNGSQKLGYANYYDVISKTN